MRRLVLLLLGALALAACAAEGGAGEDGPDLRGEWQLVAGTSGGTDLPRPPGVHATLGLTGGEARGTAFCNSWFGTVQQDGAALSIGGIGQTEMGCAPDVMAAESAYLAALGVVDTAALDGEELVLTGDGVELRFAPVPAVPPSPLEGTRWELQTLVDDETASSTVGEPAVLVLAPDGRAEATTGCRMLTASWSPANDVLVLDDLLPGAAECPPDVARQDEHVTAVLGAGPAIELREDRLTLTAPDGRGLAYRALTPTRWCPAACW